MSNWGHYAKFGPDMTPKNPSAPTRVRRSRSVSPGRPPKSEVEARWRHIFAVASREFIEHGYSAASVARIATDAAVSKKTIYARFPSKDALLVEVVSDMVSRLHEVVTDAMSISEGDPEHMLTSFGIEVARNWAHSEEVGIYRLIVSEANRFPQLAALYRDSMSRFGTTLADYLRQQDAAGILTVADADAAARQFGMLVYGPIREDVLLGDTITDDDIADVVRRGVDVFLGGYQRRAR